MPAPSTTVITNPMIETMPACLPRLRPSHAQYLCIQVPPSTAPAACGRHVTHDRRRARVGSSDRGDGLDAEVALQRLDDPDRSIRLTVRLEVSRDGARPTHG